MCSEISPNISLHFHPKYQGLGLTSIGLEQTIVKTDFFFNRVSSGSSSRNGIVISLEQMQL